MIDSVRSAILDLTAGRVCIVGVGNRQRGDDGVGPRVIDARRVGTGGVWIDAGVAPENYLEPIARATPDLILMIDAVTFGGRPGDCRLFDTTEFDDLVLSTHAGSCAMLGKYLSARTDAQLRVIGIEPESIGDREELSPPVEFAVRELTALLADLLTSEDQPEGKQMVDATCNEQPCNGRRR